MDRYESLHHEIAEFDTVEGTTPLAVAMLPEPFDKVLQRLIREGAMSVQELAEALNLSLDEAQHLGEHLVAKGYLRTEEKEGESGVFFRVYLARMRRQKIPLDL